MQLQEISSILEGKLLHDLFWGDASVFRHQKIVTFLQVLSCEGQHIGCEMREIFGCPVSIQRIDVAIKIASNGHHIPCR